MSPLSNSLVATIFLSLRLGSVDWNKLQLRTPLTRGNFWMRETRSSMALTGAPGTVTNNCTTPRAMALLSPRA